MISIEAAKRFSEQHYPEGPERLAERLKIEVRESSLTGCDGWVLSGPGATVIRINSRLSAVRRRFTLAHELGHLLLGIPTVVGESIYESLRSDSREERKVNDLAAELLLPMSLVRKAFPTVPVVASSLRKLAQQAKVSELAVAIRVASLASEVGLRNASVAFFKEHEFEWQWSKTLTMTPRVARSLLQRAEESAPQAARIERRKTNDVVVASMIDNRGFDSTILLVQLLPADLGKQLATPERRRQLEEYLFADDEQFRMQLQGVFGAFRQKCAGLSLDEAFSTFFEAKGNRWDGTRRTRLNSAKGHEYVRLRLAEWCS